MDCGIDIRYKEVDKDGDICTEFTMPGSKPVYRYFKTMESALTMATFTAAQAGVVKRDELIPWLIERGFPGREPGEVDPDDKAMKKIQIEEIVEQQEEKISTSELK